jgi:polysaccharide export outer membrane protein
MAARRRYQRLADATLRVAVALGILCNGCEASFCFNKHPHHPPLPDAPRELKKMTLPAYVIESPDIIVVEALRALPDRPISGERLVRPDGTINLGLYGSVRVAGLTLEQAKAAIEEHLSKSIKNPQVNVDVYSYNSKVYYVIADGAGFGEQVVRLPYTGNETVLDAIGQIGGLPAVADKKQIWVARPAPDHTCSDIVLPVDWNAIAQCGQTATNYQLMPGDRVYIKSGPMLAFDGGLAKLFAPFERIMGFLLLTGFTIGVLDNPKAAAGGGGGIGIR